MFTCDYKKLTLFLSEFKDIAPMKMPEYGEFCLLELKDGRLTGGTWYPDDYENKKSTKGDFSRGTGDEIKVDEVSKWHSLGAYNIAENLDNESLENLLFGDKGEGIHTVAISGFKSFADGDFPQSEQYCLVILNDGGLGAGRWNKFAEDDGQFVYASAMSSYSMEKVWAWTPLSNDDIFEDEMEEELERRKEEELNKNPQTDPVKFKYGIDIEVYYEKTLEKLRGKYYWATINKMKKVKPWEIVPLHGWYVFGKDQGTVMGRRYIEEWKDGSTADEFIDFLCEYTDDAVKNSNPEEKFKLGLDIAVYLEKAFKNVKKNYHWLNKRMLKKGDQYAIEQVNGDWEFTIKYVGYAEYRVYDCSSAENFIKNVERDYESLAIRENPVVETYEVPFGHKDLNGWNLERYDVYKMKSGDYKVNVQAGDRVTGGNREFFITPDCFKAETYDEFLDRYLEIVPGHSFGLTKKDLIKDVKLKKFFGY